MSTNKNPVTITIIQWILKARLILMACVIAAVGFMTYNKIAIDFTNRFIQVILKYHAGKNVVLDSDLVFYLIGFNLPLALIIIFEYDFLRRKKIIGFWILFALDLLAGLTTRIIFFQVVILILALLKSSRIYFHKEEKQNLPNILDEDILNETN